MTIKSLPIGSIKLDAETQSRASLNLDAVAEYAEAIEAGAKMPPITVFSDGTSYWVADGFHRFLAHQRIKRTEIEADVIEGTKRDAILFACAANPGHGLRRTNEDKRRAVAILLLDAEYSKKSNHDIAKHVSVSHTFVNNLRTAAEKPKEPAKPKQPPAPKAGPSAPKGGPTAPETGNVSGPTTPPTLSPGAAAAVEPEETDEQKAARLAAEAHGDTDLSAMLDEERARVLDLEGQIKAAEANDLAAEAMKWKRIADVAVRRQGELMERVSQREAELAKLASSLRRIGKAVGEDDPSKVAATVEQFVRSMNVGV